MRASDRAARRLVVSVVVVGGFLLACGGGADLTTGPEPAPGAVPAPAAPADIPAPSTRWMLQGTTGLYDGHGEWLAPYGGAWDVRDVYVIDASADAFFLLSGEPDEVRVAERVPGGFAVRVVREGARVVRPFGALAFVREGSGDLQLIDATGAVLLEGMTPKADRLSGPQEWPLYRPEYWWGEPYGTLPVPVCDASGRACGWVARDGTLAWGDGWARVTGFETGRATGSRDGQTWSLVPGGEPTPIPFPEGVNAFGMPSERGAVIAASVPTDQEPRRRTGVWTGTSFVEVEPRLVVDEVWCTDGTSCTYRFHQGRAAVWAIGPGGERLAGYLDESGAWAIGPTPCAAPILPGPFHDDRAFACDGAEYWMIDVDGNRIAGPYRSWGADVVGVPVTPNTYPGGLFFADGLAAVPVEGGWAYIDPSGTVVLPGPYQIARPFRDGLALVVTADGTVAYIDEGGARRVRPPATP